MPSSNPRHSPRKRGARFSDPSNASLTPFTGQFSRVSAGSRAQSLSPKKRETNQPLHIRMNLTETQMDKITDAYVSPTSILGEAKRSAHKTAASPRKSTALLVTSRRHPRQPFTEQRQLLVSPMLSETTAKRLHTMTSLFLPRQPSRSWSHVTICETRQTPLRVLPSDERKRRPLPSALAAILALLARLWFNVPN